MRALYQAVDMLETVQNGEPYTDDDIRHVLRTLDQAIRANKKRNKKQRAKRLVFQPIVVAKDRVIRFKENAICRWLVDSKRADLNQLATLPFSDADRMQFAQLIGYSVSGFGDLSYADPAVVAEADRIAATLVERV